MDDIGVYRAWVEAAKKKRNQTDLACRVGKSKFGTIGTRRT